MKPLCSGVSLDSSLSPGAIARSSRLCPQARACGGLALLWGQRVFTPSSGAVMCYSAALVGGPPPDGVAGLLAHLSPLSVVWFSSLSSWASSLHQNILERACHDSCNTVAGVGCVWVIVKWCCLHHLPALLRYDFLLTPDKAWPWAKGTVVTELLLCSGGAASLTWPASVRLSSWEPWLLRPVHPRMDK